MEEKGVQDLSINNANLVKTDRSDDNNNNNIIDDMRNQKAYEYDDIFDVAIIGAGFAGLSAALLFVAFLSGINFNYYPPYLWLALQ